MATRQKKKPAADTRAVPAKKKKKAPARSAPAKKPPYNGVARLVGGLVCLLLALCVAVSYFRGNALFVDFLARLIKGLFGYGYWLAAIALAAVGVFQIGHGGKPVILRTVCTLLMVPLMGSLLHLLLSHARYDAGGLDLIKSLWADGQTVIGGGVISGAVAVGLKAVFGKAITAILLIVLLLLALMGATQVTPSEIAEHVRERERYGREEDEDENEIPVSPRQKAIETGPRRPAARPVIDFPLDDETPSLPEKKPPEETRTELDPPVKKNFFARKGKDVKSPDEVLDPAKIPQEKKETGEEKTHRRQKPSLSEEELAEETRKVSKEIDEKQPAEAVYQYPPVTLLDQNTSSNISEVGAELRLNSRRLAEALRSFGVDATAGEVIHGPTVTRYEFTLDQGVKLSKVTNLADDIALALGASGVRIAPIPNKISVVGIEVPNRAVTAVRIRDVIESGAFTEHKSRVAFAIGKDIGGSSIVGDISRLPHVLIAGTTGSGKSVCTNSLIVSLLYKATPEEVRFIMVDPKMVELAPYNGIPHLLIPVVTDPKKAAGALQWAVFEMMKRYKTFSENGVKDLAGFNALAANNPDLKKLPTVVVVIDELADLMLAAAKEVEESICRVAQMGRAAGMHLVIATQRPSADVITGLMKANIPSRIAFAVASSLESRIILDTTGAEKLVGKGDMLYFPLGMQKPLRVQGCFITPEEIERVIEFVKENGKANYDQKVIEQIEAAAKKDEKGKAGSSEEEDSAADDGDELLPAAVDIMLEIGQASTSMLQRKLKLGYSRASRLVDQMEERGYVGPFNGSKPREILITKAQWQELKMKMSGGGPEEPPEIDRAGTIRDVFDSHDALD